MTDFLRLKFVVEYKAELHNCESNSSSELRELTRLETSKCGDQC